MAEAVGDGGLQGLVNNAGFGIFLPVEEFPGARAHSGGLAPDLLRA